MPCSDFNSTSGTVSFSNGQASRTVTVSTIEDLFDEPHLASSGFFRTEEHPTEGPLRVTRHPLDFSGVVEQPSRPAPHMGEHNRDILTEAGLTAEEITGLEASGVLGRVE